MHIFGIQIQSNNHIVYILIYIYMIDNSCFDFECLERYSYDCICLTIYVCIVLMIKYNCFVQKGIQNQHIAILFIY